MTKSDAPIGWRRKSRPSPVFGSNSIFIVALRADGDRPYSTEADESVIEPPKPVIVWKVRLGSTTTVSYEGGVLPKVTVPWSAIFSEPSGVVTHTWAAGLAGACASAGTAGTPSTASAAADRPDTAACRPRGRFLIALLHTNAVKQRGTNALSTEQKGHKHSAPVLSISALPWRIDR